MPYTDSIVELVDYLAAKVQAVQDSLGIVDVFYGDQSRIPRSPCVCIEPDNKIRELAGVPRRTENIIVIHFIVYHSEIREQSGNRRDSDQLANDLEAVLHLDPQLGGRVRHCFVRESTSGYVKKNNQVFRAHRLSLECRNTTQLPPSP